MRLRALFLSSLLLAVPVTAPQPAAAQYWTDWKAANATLSYRIVAATRETVNGYPRTAVTWEVQNKGEVIAIRDSVHPGVRDEQGKSGYATELLVPETFTRIPGTAALKPGITRFLTILPVKGESFPNFVLTVHGPDGYPVVLTSIGMGTLYDKALNGVGDQDLPLFAGRWRTNLGTLLEIRHGGFTLEGSSSLVGGGTDYGPSYVFVREPRSILRANLREPGGAHEQLSSLMLSHDQGRQLLGRFTDGQYRNKPFHACKVGEDEIVGDDRLRTGGFFWARLERLATAPAENGKVQIDVTFRVWNVNRYAGSFQPVLAGEDGRTYGGFETVDRGQPVGPVAIEPCGTSVASYRAIALPEEAQKIVFSAGPNFTPISDPWDISERVNSTPHGSPADNSPPSGTGSPNSPSTPGSPITPAPSRPPAQLREYANYGIWDFKVEELAPGPDGNWQAVVRVRDAAVYHVGLTTGGVMLTLFDDDGRSVVNYETLFRASVTGKLSELEAIPQTMWMEKGDEIRVRLFIPHSAGFKPVRVRLGSGDRETLSRTFPFN